MIRSLLKFVFRTAVGALFFYLVAPTFLAMAAIACICTAGLALIIVLPGLYYTGLLLTVWWVPFGREESAQGAKTTAANSTYHSGYRMALHEYVTKARMKGRKWEEIEKELRNRGWGGEWLAVAQEVFNSGAA
jgi:hypothetical protein